MKRETAIKIAISIIISLIVLSLVSNFFTREINKDLVAKLSEQRKEIGVKDIRINLLQESNKALKELADSQKKLIDGESLDEFMKMYESNEVAEKVEILIHTKNSETGYPRMFTIIGGYASEEEDQ